MPPKIFGCNVLTLPPSIDGKFVKSCTLLTLMPRFRIYFSVPPVEINSIFNEFKCLINLSKLSLLKTDIKAVLIFFLLALGLFL